MRLLLAGCCLTLTLSLSLVAAPRAPEASECVACHDKVDLAAFRTRTHGKLGCVTCHTAITALPHAEKLPPPQCVRCHRHEGQDFAGSVHGRALKEGKGHAPTCTTCHGHAHDIMARSHPASKVARQNMDATCGQCHDKGFLDRLNARLARRASRMGLKAMPQK